MSDKTRAGHGLARSTGVSAESLAATARGQSAAWLAKEVAAGFLVGAALDLAPPVTKTPAQAHSIAALVAAPGKLMLLPLRRSPSSSNPFITIGRMNGNDVCIPHPDVSRFHAFVIEGDGFAILDADSTNGTFTDGVAAPRRSAAAPPARLRSRQLIRFGPITTAFVDVLDATSMLESVARGEAPGWLAALFRALPQERHGHDVFSDADATRRMKTGDKVR